MFESVALKTVRPNRVPFEAYMVVCKPFFVSAFSADSAVNPACCLVFRSDLHVDPAASGIFVDSISCGLSELFRPHIASSKPCHKR